jgi:hypothetical protein
MTWGERFLGAAIGALVTGAVVALLGLGPDRVVAWCLAAGAATMAGALIDDQLEARFGSDRRRPRDGEPTPVERHPVSAPRPREPGGASPIVATAPTAAPTPDWPAAPRRGATPQEAPPPARWVQAEPPCLDHPSDLWAGQQDRDLLACHLARPARANAVCTDCGRTVCVPDTGPPVDCPVPSGRASCPLEKPPRDVVLVTDFQSLRGVSKSGPSRSFPA